MPVTREVASALHANSVERIPLGAALSRRTHYPKYELSRFDPVARDGVDHYCRMARRIASLVQAQFGVLGISHQQRAMGDVGVACTRVRAYFAADLSRLFEHSRSAEERSGSG